jgi:Rieske Fe-S protein
MNPAIPDRAAELSRRNLIRNAGLSTLALGALSACSNYGNNQTAAPPGASTSAGGGAAESQGSGGSGSGGSVGGSLTTPKADIPVGGGKIFTDAQVVVTQPKSGEFKAFTAVCTHQTCIVAEVLQTINCNCHGSKFSITDGSVVTGPATAPLASKKVTAKGNNLTVT